MTKPMLVLRIAGQASQLFHNRDDGSIEGVAEKNRTQQSANSGPQKTRANKSGVKWLRFPGCVFRAPKAGCG
jgi:hypothetical protein